MGAEKQIACKTHGMSRPAFVCGHLVENPAQRWFAEYPSRRNPYPDAWCAACEERFQAKGGWTAANEKAANIQLICGRCHEDLHARSIPALEARVLDAWNRFLSDCMQSLQRKQSDFQEMISGLDRYDYDQASKRIVFSSGGHERLQATIEAVGSYATTSATWMWSWANFSLLAKVRTRIKQVRRLGEQEAFPRLTTALWPASEADAWAMTTVAAHVLKADAVYRSPHEHGALFLALSKIRPV